MMKGPYSTAHTQINEEQGLKEYLAYKKQAPTPEDHRGALGIVLL